jgi:hypothetical protein
MENTAKLMLLYYFQQVEKNKNNGAIEPQSLNKSRSKTRNAAARPA